MQKQDQQGESRWVPAFAGMTAVDGSQGAIDNDRHRSKNKQPAFAGRSISN